MNVKKIVEVVSVLGVVGYGVFKIVTGEPQKYSTKWFNTVSDTVLNEEREIVRKQYCSAENNFNKAAMLERLLQRFDETMSKRAWKGSTDYKFPVYSEHGWHLPSDD